MPPEIEYDLETLHAFLDKDPEPVLVFYGGEPTLRPSIMAKILDWGYPAVLQTNGLLLDSVQREELERIHTILLSLDGDKEHTDGHRGEGVYEKAIANTTVLRERGFTGDVVARMAVPVGTDIYKQTMHLWETGLFQRIYWQLDVMWHGEQDKDEVKQWFDLLYEPGITRLVDRWVTKMERDGVVEGWVPFSLPMHTLLTGKPTFIRCGAGHDHFSITTTGQILFCPICPEFEFARLGHIDSSEPTELVDVKVPGEPCVSCDIRWVCGGRCLFANHAKPWGEDGYLLVCSTIRHLVNELEKNKGRVARLIDEGKIQVDDLLLTDIHDSLEVIP